MTRKRTLQIVALCLLPWLMGCAARVAAPAVTTPRTVQLLEHGRHSSLLLTAADETRLRYAYADWRWYVEGEHGIGPGTRALFSPTKAALGRQVIAPEQPGERLQDAIGVGISAQFDLTAEADRVDALLDTLDRQFRAVGQPPQYNEQLNLELVPHPRPYTFAYNSNHMVADWLRELGITVEGNPAIGSWRLSES